jgi:hypothetical protein
VTSDNLPTGRYADTPPVVPAGLDAYRLWEQWPRQRIGVRAYLRSTYDRTGRNNTADASHYLYGEGDDFHVTLDVEGSGVLYFVRANRWHGSPWHYEIDGRDHVVQESTTPNPLEPLDDSVFLPQAAFPSPLTYTYATTRGADLNWVPMPFGERLRLAHSRTYYGTGYFIYHLIAAGTPLSRPMTPWHGGMQPDPAVLDLLSRAGSDIAPTESPGLIRREGMVRLPGDGAVTLVRLDNGPATVRRLAFSAPAGRARDVGQARLRITWDDRAAPSVDAPVDLFFGAGTLHNSDGREWLVKALPMGIRFRGERVELACYLPMPFFRSASIELVGGHGGAPLEDVRWSLRTVPYDGPWNHVGYLHATYRDHAMPRLGEDLTFLDTRGMEGADDWSGSLVGTSLVFTDRNVFTTLEGDPRFYFDDSQTPQAQGTGTEEWGGGGDYWGGRTITLPLAGHPVGVADATSASCPEDLIHSAYRFLLADLMPFGKRARICFEHGGENESTEHYRSVVHWYGLPSPSLVLTDTLDVGDTASEAAHSYHSPDASQPYVIRSRYEWGPDHLSAALGWPLAHPRDYLDYEFDAPAGRYHLWIEAQVGETLFEASVWPQVNHDIGRDALQPGYMGSIGYQNFGRSPGTYRFGSAGRPAGVVELRSPGIQRLRIQPRHGTSRLCRILLSPHRSEPPAQDFTPDAADIVLTPAATVGLAGAFERVADAAAPGGETLMLTEAPPQIEIFPAAEVTGRRTLGTSELTLQIRPDNHGVLLRRTLDYHYANQRARVFVECDGAWRLAGIWYLAGSCTVYHSFPWAEGELAPARPVVMTSNRRFRDDEFLVPAHLTRGKQRIRIRIEFAPRNPPLLPGRDPQPTAWTELAYQAYSYVMPAAPL